MVWSSKRILIITTIIALIVLGCSYVWHAHRAAEDLKAMMAKGKLEAEIAVEKNRTTYHRLSNDLALLFVDKLPGANTCYDAAISNYIEDQWNVLLAANGCSSMKEMCNKGPNAERSLEESMKWISDDSVHDKRALAIKIANIWYIAAQLYNYTRQLHYALDPNAEEQSFSGEENQKARAAFLLKEMADHHLDGSSGQQRLDRLSYYIASCKMHQPVNRRVFRHHAYYRTGTSIRNALET